MKKLINYTVAEYSESLSKKVPVPGGGSAAALTGALGASLISMVVNYSLGKKGPTAEAEFKKILKQSEILRKRLLVLVDLDAQAYLGVVNARNASEARRKAASRRAAEVPLEIARRCSEAMELAPYLVLQGNKYLLSDVEVALDLLEAGFKSAMINVRVNQ